MSQDPTPLDLDMLSALRTAMPPVDAPADARARILAAVQARIATLPPAGGGNGGGGAIAPAARGLLAAHPVLALSTAFLVGGAIGAWARGAPTERVTYVDRVATAVAAPPQAPVPAAAEPTAPAVPVESLPHAATSQPVAPAPADSGQQLAAESALLDLARTAIAHGEGAQALDAVARHGAQFPHGMLTEEREALAIKALLLADRGDEARVRATHFREHYPQSLFLPALESKLRALP